MKKSVFVILIIQFIALLIIWSDMEDSDLPTRIITTLAALLIFQIILAPISVLVYRKMGEEKINASKIIEFFKIKEYTEEELRRKIESERNAKKIKEMDEDRRKHREIEKKRADAEKRSMIELEKLFDSIENELKYRIRKGIHQDGEIIYTFDFFDIYMLFTRAGAPQEIVENKLCFFKKMIESKFIDRFIGSSWYGRISFENLDSHYRPGDIREGTPSYFSYSSEATVKLKIA